MKIPTKKRKKMDRLLNANKKKGKKNYFDDDMHPEDEKTPRSHPDVSQTHLTSCKTHKRKLKERVKI